MFRSCNARSDIDAKKFMHKLQSKGDISFPQKIHIEDISTCLPDTWKVRDVWLVVAWGVN